MGDKRTSKQTGQAMTPLQRAEARLQAVAAELQQEKHRRDELGKKRERFIRAVAEAKTQRENYAYEAHGRDNPEAMKLLADAQRRSREAEDGLIDLDAAITTCEQRVTDLEAKQQECQRAVTATTAASHGERVEETARKMDLATPQLVNLIVELKNNIDAAKAWGNNALGDAANPPAFWQLSTSAYIRYLLAHLIEKGVDLFGPESKATPPRDERREFIQAGSFENYISGLVGKGVRRLGLEPPNGHDPEIQAAEAGTGA